MLARHAAGGARYIAARGSVLSVQRWPMSVALPDLPHDCLCHVLYWAGPAVLRSSIPLTCRALRMRSWEDTPWRKLCGDRFGHQVASSVAAAGRLRRWRCIYGTLERWASRIGYWQLFDAYPFGMLVIFRWSSSGGVVADVVDVKVGERGSLTVNRAQLIEVIFEEIDASRSADGICNSSDRVFLRLHGCANSGSSYALAVDTRIQSATDRAKFVPPPPVRMRFVGEQHVPPDLFGPRAAQEALERTAEIMVVEWSATEQGLPEGAPNEAEAICGGWRKHVSVASFGTAGDENNEEVELSQAPVPAAYVPTVIPRGHREIMEALNLQEGRTWTPPVGHYDEKPNILPGQDWRVTWLLRGIEARGPAVRSLAHRFSAFTMSLLEAVLPSEHADDCAQPVATPERLTLSMTLGRLAGWRPQPQIAAGAMMPQPGLYCGDYGPLYSPFNIEIIEVHYERVQEPGTDESENWLYGTKVTGDMHVCMGMRTFRVNVQAGAVVDGEQHVNAEGRPVWEAAVAMRDLAGADKVLCCWPGYGTLAQMGGRAEHEQPGHLVLWTSGQLAFCWNRGQAPVLLHSLEL